jgi:hypothetical protein
VTLAISYSAMHADVAGPVQSLVFHTLL